MSREKTKRIFIISILSLIVLLSIAIILNFLIHKKKESVSELISELENLEKDNSYINIQSLGRGSDLDKILSYVVSENETVVYIKSLEDVASANNLNIVIENIETRDVLGKVRVKKDDGSTEVKEERTHSELLVTLRVNGGWSNIISFITAVQKNNKYSIFGDFRLAASFDSGGGWVLNTVVKSITK